MRYKISTDRLVNMLTPSFWGGRNHILWLQSLCYPIQVLNNEIQKFFIDKQLESVMTSQVKWFEWYLNYNFEKYFDNKNDRIKIVHFKDYGVPIYFEHEQNGVPYVVYFDGEDSSVSPNEEEHPKPLFLKDEAFFAIGASFEVLIPPILIPESEFTAMASFILNKYRLASKTFKITYK